MRERQSSISLLVFFGLALVSFSTLANAAVCPLYSPSNSNFYQAPVAVSTPQFSSSQTCCTDSLARNISSGTDEISAYILSNINKADETCRASIMAIAASVCSPLSENFISSHSYGIEMNLCPLSLCAKFQTDCQAANFKGKSVTQYDTELLCSMLLPSPKYRVSVPTGTHPNCFANPSSTNPSPCGPSDYVGAYTRCSISTREVVYTWKPESTCQGGQPLPPPITGLPCEVSCPVGSYLPLGTTSCVSCPTGSYSFGGGSRVAIWKEWPTPTDYRLHTYCMTAGVITASGFNTTCGWQLDDNEIKSGVIPDSSKSVLQLRTYIIGTAGAIEFAYQIDSEANFDGLKVNIDAVEKLSVLRPVNQWTIARFPLSPGGHVIEFIYYKDFSESQGADAAFIQYIQLEGTFAVPESCNPCPAGSYTDQSGSFNCTKCPANTYSPSGAPSCTACSDGSYSFPGSFQCTPRPPCNTSDYESIDTPCYLNADNRPVRNRRFQWIQPQICQGGVTLPTELKDLPCAPCNPGQYRSGASCLFCPVGTFNNGTNDAQCSPCPQGQVAPLSLYYTQFQSWPPGFSTTCIGNGCGTNGWRLLGDSVDAGVGHLIPAESILYYNLSLSRPGTLFVDYEFHCNSICKFSVRLSGQTAGRFSQYGARFRYTKQIALVAGSQIVDFTFNKIDTSTLSSFDTVIIHSIHISGTDVGGAVSCVSCPIGYTAPPLSSACSACPAGTYRNSTSVLSCQPCGSNSYSSAPGSVNCETCGHNIQSTADRTSCNLNSCHFPVSSDIVYDLSMLRLPTEMWGPIFDQNGHTYYLNMCNKYHSNRTCFDTNGVAIPSYACQVTSAGLGKDLGHVMGYYPLATDMLSAGLLVEFLHGSVSNSGCGGKERSTTVSMVCDPTAGVGQPQGIEPVETAKCVYTFTWHSLYACPVCTARDYYPILSECIGGNQTRTWSPLNDPQRCHDGFQRPANEIIPCAGANSIYCPPGQYLFVDSRTLQTSCVPAPPGYYTIGGGKTWTTYDPKPADFEGDWLGGPHYMMSGIDETTMELRINLVVAGNVSFQYKVYSTGSEAPNDGFQFLIDGVVMVPLTQDTNFRYVTYSTTFLATGPHVLRWTFRGGDAPTSSLRFKGALVRRVLVLGTSRAALQPIPCPAGFFSSTPGSTSCSACPLNTYSTGGSATCQACPTSGHYALPGSGNCQVKPICTEDDFMISYTTCSNYTRTRRYIPLEPQICRIDPSGFVPPALPQTGLDCGPCPPGSHRMMGNNCTFCPLGTGHASGDSSMMCTAASAGSFAKPVRSYFIDNSISTWPTGFSTYCSGESCLSPGWRLRGTSIDSGIHHIGEIDSVLDLSANLITDGAVSFSYDVSGTSLLDGLEFYVDGLQQTTTYHPSSLRSNTISIPLTAGAHTLRWVYHQDIGPSGVQLSDIEISGDATGGADEITPCPVGMYSDSSRQLTCQPCPKGKVTNSPGSSQCTLCPDDQYQYQTGQVGCQPCGAGTAPSPDHSACLTSCTWDFGTPTSPIVYNFSAIGSNVYRGYVGNVDILFRLCSTLPSDNTCVRQNGERLSSYSCGVDYTTGKVIDLGERLSVSYTPSPIVNKTEDSSITFLYEDGEICKGGTHWTTKLVNYCYDDVLNPPIRREISLNDCQYMIIIHNLMGCRVCTPADFEVTKTACIDGKRTVSTVRSTACNSQFETQNYIEACNSSDVETPLWVFFGLLIAFAVVGTVLIVYIVKHRQVTAQYEVLINNSPGDDLDTESPSQSHREAIDE